MATATGIAGERHAAAATLRYVPMLAFCTSALMLVLLLRVLNLVSVLP